MTVLGNGIEEITNNKLNKDNAKCGVCGQSIVFDAKKKYYVCLGRKNKKCEQGYMKQDELESDFKQLVAGFQRIVRKVKVIKELKVTLRKGRTQLIKQIERSQTALAKEAKKIRLVDERQSLDVLGFAVNGAQEKQNAQTKSRKRLDATKELQEGIVLLSYLMEGYEATFCPATRIFKSLSIRDSKIVAVELMPGIDYLVQLARNDGYYVSQVKIEHDKTLLEIDFNSLLDKFGTNIWESCIYFRRRPSQKTLKRRDQDWLEDEPDDRLLQKLLKNQHVKRALKRIEHPTERERAIDYVFSLDNAPSLYDSGGPLVITPDNAAKVLEHHLKELEWLIKKQPSVEELYCDWEDQTRHSIGKIFGFESETYLNFVNIVDFQSLILSNDAKRIKQFLALENKTKTYLGNLLTHLEMSVNGPV